MSKVKIAVLESQVQRLLDKQKELTERVRANEKVVAAIGLLGSVVIAILGTGIFQKAEACSPPLDGSEFTTKQFRTWFYRMTKFTDENKRWGKTFQPYGLRHYYATTRLQNGTSQYALCKNMGVTEPYLRKHYSKYLNRLATKELMKFSKEVGLGGRIIPKGQDFLIDEI